MVTNYFLLALTLVVISGCITKPQPVALPPVTEGWRKVSAIRNAYIVQPQDTIYSVAWAFGIDYRDLAIKNNLGPPYNIHPGQSLRITLEDGMLAVGKNRNGELTISDIKSLKGWVWPSSGKIISTFSNKPDGNNGIDIAGRYGQNVVASNRGQVVYSGIGIRSYGKLIIIKHSDDYLTAYAYNKNVLVAEGERVRVGQKIATMGKNDEGKAVLHFEIRRLGERVDPLIYLPKRHDRKQ